MDESARNLLQLIMGFRMTQLIYVAAKLNLADRLAEKPQTVEELAGQVAADPPALYRVLRALASMGLFEETADRVFALTPAGGPLRSNIPGSIRNVALLYGEEWVWRSYGNMLFSTRTGKPAFPETNGLAFYEYLDQHPIAADVFQAAMSSFSDQEASAILAAYEFTGVNTIVDVGAGHGALLEKVLRAHPSLSGIAFDVPANANDADRLFASNGLVNRAFFVGGDFFAELPQNADLYLMKSVLHNWDNAAAKRILDTCRRAVSPHSRLLIIERVIPAGNGASEAKLFDINMLVTVGGRERTEHEYTALLADTGFILSRVIPTPSPLTLLEAAPRP